MRGRCWRHSTCSHGLRVKYVLFYVLYKGDLCQSYLCSLSGPIEVPAVEFGEGDISAEAETQRQRRSRSAKIFRRLVPLARSATASVDFSVRDHSRHCRSKFSTMVCSIRLEEFRSGVPRRFLLSVVLFSTTFPRILLLGPSMRQVTSW